MVYLMQMRTFLPDHGVPTAPGDERRGSFLTELMVGPSSSVIGKAGGVALPLGGADRHFGGPQPWRGPQTVPGRSGIRCIDQLRHPARLSDQYNGLYRRRLPMPYNPTKRSR